MYYPVSFGVILSLCIILCCMLKCKGCILCVEADVIKCHGFTGKGLRVGPFDHSLRLCFLMDFAQTLCAYSPHTQKVCEINLVAGN